MQNGKIFILHDMAKSRNVPKDLELLSKVITRESREPRIMRKTFKNQGLGKLTARTRYYWDSHVKRWEARYEREYPECSHEIGIFFGVRWLSG